MIYTAKNSHILIFPLSYELIFQYRMPLLQFLQCFIHRLTFSFRALLYMFHELIIVDINHLNAGEL